MSKPDVSVPDAADDFDPSTVPMYPMLRAEIRGTDDGEFIGLLDDEVLVTADELESVRSAIIATAARTAARRLGDQKAIRVRGQAPDGGVFQMVVTGTGDVHDTSGPTPGTTAAASSSTSTSTPRKGKRTIQTPDPDSNKKFRLHPILLVILGFPLAMIGFFVWFLFFRGASAPAPVTVPAPYQLPVVAPQGYSPVAKWAVKVGTASGTTTGGVTANAEQVYAATGSNDHLTAYAASNGVQSWSTDLGSPLTAGPTLTVVDDVPVLVAATASKLITLDPASGAETGEWKFDQAVGSQVRITATGPVVVGQSNVAQIIVDGELATRIMPAGALPVAPGPDGSLIAVTRDRVYASTSSSVSGAGRAIKPVGDGTVTVAGWTGDRLVLAYATSSATTNGVKLAGYTAPPSVNGAWRRDWRSSVLPSTAGTGTYGTQLPLVTGPAHKWGIYNGATLTLTDGTTHSLGQWSTVSVGDQIAFGAGATQVLSAGPDGLGGRSDPQQTSMQVIAPQAVVDSAPYLVVTAAGGTTAWLYALTPTTDDTTADEPADTSASTSPSATPRSTESPSVHTKHKTKAKTTAESDPAAPLSSSAAPTPEGGVNQ